ncbi:MAG: hypothetical protein K1X95_09750 [Acidimicrobiia bacterium]|nr:hypothetical protein [Acidimicrobiia bacterium]
MHIDVAPLDVDEIVALVLAADLAGDAETARLLVDLDVVRVDTLASDSAKYLVNVNGRQAVVDAVRGN